MYKSITIFTSILILLPRGRFDQVNDTACCHESVVLNTSLPNSVNIHSSYLSENIASKDRTHSPLDDEGRPLERTMDYVYFSASTEPPIKNVCSSDWKKIGFYKTIDGYFRFNTTTRLAFNFYPYYECKEVTGSKTIGNLYIKCPRDKFVDCCPQGNLIFEKDEEIGISWECSLNTNELIYWDYQKMVPRNHQPHILLHNTFHQKKDNILKGSVEVQYIIIRSFKPYSNNSKGLLNVGRLFFDQKFICSDENINGSNAMQDQELVCRKRPYVDEFQEIYAVLKCLCIIFGSATLLIFIMLPPLRTMKTTIILCQTFSYLVRDVVDLRFNLGGWQPTYTECITVAYNLHFWDLAASFWGNVMSIDLALTFRGQGLNRGKNRTTFILYSFYGWGSPLFITLVTAILGFLAPLPREFLKPEVNLEHCWFQPRAGMMYHHIPAMVLSALNVPLLAYAVYKIITSVCTADMLNNKESGQHVGNRVKKQSRTRLILYFNLALLIGSPKSIQYAKLLTNNSTLVLVFNATSVLRAICMFLFVSCKKRVFQLIKKRLLFESLSVSSMFTSFSSKSYDMNGTKVSNYVAQDSTAL